MVKSSNLTSKKKNLNASNKILELEIKKLK